jgi:hypothetical protein
MIFNPKKIGTSINKMADDTGMCPHDIVSTLHRLRMIDRDPESQRFKIHRRQDLIDIHLEKQKKGG